MFLTMDRKFLNKGQSFFEVIMAMAIITIVLIALVGLASISIKNATFTKSKTQATRFSQEAIEWLRGERDAAWTAFTGHTAIATWCLSTSLSWTDPGSCGASDVIADTTFQRSVTFTTIDLNTVQADVKTAWTDSQGYHEVITSTFFTNWKTSLLAGIPTPTPTIPPTTTPSPTPTPAPTPIPPAIAWWKFDDGSTSTVADSAGLNQGTWGSGLFGGSGGAYVAGVSGTAGSFTGSNNVTFNATIGNFGTGNFSVAYWIKTSLASISYVISKRATCAHGNFWNSFIQAGAVAAEIDQDTLGTNYAGIGSGATTVNNNAWHFVTFTRSGTQLTLYIDGNSTGVVNSAGITNLSNITNLGLAISPCTGTGGSVTFTGALDDIRIFNYALTQPQVQHLRTYPGQL
jgi:Tfp pilus assembly protein PilV